MRKQRGKIDYAAAAALLEGGVTVPEVAERFGVTANAVYTARKKGRLVIEHPPEFNDGGEHFEEQLQEGADALAIVEMRSSMERLIEACERLDAR